ncbi:MULTISPECIES: ead/Ea22-like family protein [Citrobacter]|uniref:Ead/Ea22-like family protein n=1 Tax=Citrobacter braakii TaxID=57706 RepID=A0A8I0GA48_CITBR|nr:MULTISPECIES: ead/Ea22-like family protein [Citrobacter]MBD3124915.1 ead/Ea22-like family protein [Citrobacter braakii]MDM3440518.1 ead/Ea22-like family protein [Citrobacter sp. Cb063]WIF76258.1 ead/Ea22-like family protein [Citrobacter braakii]
MKALNKQALRERYSSQPVPKCHICGAEMTVQRMSASRITYGCTGATYDDKGCHYAEGRSIADDHYEQSRVTVVDVSDPEVLAMLDELEKTQKGEKQWREVVDAFYVDDADWHKLTTSNNELISFLSQALCKQVDRIAELEALTVNLPKRSVGEVMHMSGFSRDYAEGWCSGNDNAIHEIRAAGISVKER